MDAYPVRRGGRLDLRAATEGSTPIDDCAFCQISAGKSPAKIACDDVEWTAFPPLGPHAPGHMLFIPRRHVPDATTDPGLTGVVFAAASAYLGRTLKSEGNILTSVGASATQTVMHLHVHVIPRGPGDGLHHDWPWRREHP